MRRAIVTGAATVSGVVLLLGLKPHSTAPLAAKGADDKFTITQSGVAGEQSGQSGQSGQGGQPSAGSSQPGSAPSSPSSSSSPSSAAPGSSAPSTSAAPKSGTSSTSAKTVTGDAAPTRYGPVQVAVTFSGQKITRIQVLEYPTETGRDQEINSYAIPQLNQQAMSAQSANIDGVSGATYTSEGYQQSLQSAIDKAGT